MISNEKTKIILKKAKNEKEKIIKEVEQRLKENSLIYKKETYPLCINPLILKKNSIKEINKISKEFTNLIQDTIEILKKDERIFKEYLGDHPLYLLLKENLKTLRKKDFKNIYYRLDGIISKDGIKIIEANTDSPGGLFTLEKMHKIIASIYSKEIKKEKLYIKKGSKKLIKNFSKQYKKNFKKGELFIILGNKEDEEKEEHKLIAKKLKEKNIPAINLDYRNENLLYKDKNLFYKDRKVGIIYRRVFPLDKTPQIIENSKRGKTRIINPPFSKMLGSKALFVLFKELKDKELRKHKIFIEKYISETFFLRDMNKKELISNKDKYVIKETFLSCGKGINIGKEESKKKWEKAVKEASYKSVVQKYYEQPKGIFIDNKKSKEEERKFDTNIYILGKNAIMPYTRINSKSSFKSNNACGSSEGIFFIEK